MTRLLLSLSITLVWVVYIRAQSDLSIGQWKSFLPLQQGQAIAQTPEQIIYASDWSLILIDKEDFSAQFMSKVEGLSDIGIQDITYDPFNDQLFVLYRNSNIDILKGGQVLNIPNIKLNNNISGDKRILKAFIRDSQSAFLATGFGIVEFNPQSLIFGSTTFSGLLTNALASHKGKLYAATEEGLYYIEENEQLNPGDFNQWESTGSENGLPLLFEAIDVLSWSGWLYLATNSTLYRSLDGINFNVVELPVDGNFKFTFLSPGPDFLVAGLQDETFISHVYFIDERGSVLTRDESCVNRVKNARVDEIGRIWYADAWNDIRYTENMGGACRRLNYNSPYAHDVSDLAVKDGSVLVASGGVSESYLYLFGRQGFYLSENSQWNNFNEFVDPMFGDYDLLSVHRVAFHPERDILYAGSYWAGLLEVNRESSKTTLFNKTNSSLRGAVGDEARERVTGMAFDEEGNMWVSTFGAPEPINVMSPDGEWNSFSVISPLQLTDVTIDEEGYKWFPVYGNSGGVLVYDSGASLDDPSDDRQRFVNQSNSELTTNLVNSIAVDLDGAVWVGTSEGPVVFDCGTSVFDSECRGLRKKVLEDNIAAFLLADQDIRSIVVDGANRKWFGTRNGLFAQSADAEESVARFNTDNSPLFDDHVRALGYDELNGNLYIGTDKGLMAYRTASTAGASRHREEAIYAFPNPVRPGYSGLIAIKGLVQNAQVKITDVNGNLIYETRALGGQAIWDGKDQGQNRVASGVYLVFSNNTDSFDEADTFVTKIMILR